MKKIISNVNIFMCLFTIVLLCLSCKKQKYYNYDGFADIKMPILSMEYTPVIDLDEIERYETRSLVPSMLTKGVNHQLVMDVQLRLMELGYMEQDKPTTFYGESTENAVRKFQRQIGVSEDGVCTTELYSTLLDKSAPSYETKRGFKGSDIKTIQERLYELSYLLFDYDINGYFGEKTESAIKSMQKNNKLKDTGVIDLKTYNLMYSDKVVSYTIDRQSSPEVIKLYQEKLRELGYYTKEIDGVYNSHFREAVREYQMMNSQIPNGYINSSTKFSIDSIYARPFLIYIGIESNRVKQVQEKLVALNYLEKRYVNGYYGEYTAQAIAVFQKNNNLPVTGLVEGETMATLDSLVAIPSDRPVNSPKQFIMKTEDIKNSVKENRPEGTVEDLVKVALIKLNSKYIWGHRGPNTFDCSGFVYWCLNQVGVNVDYMSTYNWRFSTQFERVENFDDLEFGDLIIVDGHMGIVADNSTVVDASSSNGKVVHRDLDEWWRQRFLLGFRIFDNNEENAENQAEQ